MYRLEHIMIRQQHVNKGKLKKCTCILKASVNTVNCWWE